MLKKISYNTNFVYFIVLLTFVLVRICSNLGAFDFLGDSASTVMSFVTQIGIIFLLPTFLFKTLNKWKWNETFEFYTYKKTSWKVILIAFGLGVIVFLINIYVSTFFNTIIQFFGYKPSSSLGNELPPTWWGLILDLISTAVLPAICEETLHRGMLLKGNSALGMRKSIILSGVLFGLLHLNIEQFFYATLIGFFLGYLCWSCNSIYPCMIIHFMNNALSVFFAFARMRGWAIGKIFTQFVVFVSHNQILGFVLFVLLLCFLIFLGYEATVCVIKWSFDYNFGKRQRELANLAIREKFFKQVDDIKNNTSNGEQNFYRTADNVVYIDLKEFVNFVGKSIEENSKENQKTDENIEKTQKNCKKIANIELKTKIFIWGSLFLGAVVTLMTYIWGVLR